MRNKLSPLMLRNITKTIQSGAPVWGLLRANEYLTPEDPLRKVLMHTAIAKFNEGFHDQTKEVLEQVASGLTRSDIPYELSPTGVLIARKARSVPFPGGVRRYYSNYSRPIRLRISSSRS